MNKPPVLLFLVSLALLALGVWAGEPQSVWQKAVTVCLSCMGIG